MPKYTQDWFTNNLQAWNQHVASYLQAIATPLVLEIGAFEGRASLWFLDEHPDLLLTVVDPWNFTAGASDETFDTFMNNVSPYKSRVSVIRGKSEEVIKDLGSDKYDIIYIDGDHTSGAVMYDAIIGFQLVKKGGMIIFDDYLGGDLSINYPKPAIDFFHESYSALGRLDLLHDGYQRIYMKK